MLKTKSTVTTTKEEEAGSKSRLMRRYLDDLTDEELVQTIRFLDEYTLDVSEDYADEENFSLCGRHFHFGGGRCMADELEYGV